MEKNIDEICEELDNLTLRSLQLMDEKIAVNIEMEKIIREGYIELAKARYIRGKESIGPLQIPKDGQMNSLFELETSSIDKNGNDLPSFDISLKIEKDNSEKLQDPIKWFGVLVPQNLRTAQKRFQESLYLIVRAANISSELDTIPGDLESLKSLKATLAK